VKIQALCPYCSCAYAIRHTDPVGRARVVSTTHSPRGVNSRLVGEFLTCCRCGESYVVTPAGIEKRPNGAAAPPPGRPASASAHPADVPPPPKSILDEVRRPG